MKLREFFGRAVAAARARDIRGEEELDRVLSAMKEEYDALDEFNRRSFDTERLTNPYGDARVIHSSRRELRKVLVTIELDLASLVLAQQLRHERVPLDMVLGYLPGEKAASSSSEAFDLKEAALRDLGVEDGRAREVLSRARREAELALPGDSRGIAEAAERLDLSVGVLKSPADIMAAWYLEKLLEKHDAETVGALAEAIDAQPEFKRSARANARVVIASGGPDAKTGGTCFDVVGPGPLPVEALAALLDAGETRTVCMLPAGNAPAELARSRGANLLYLPPSAVRSLGMNVLLDTLDPSREIDFVSAGGFTRHRR